VNNKDLSEYKVNSENITKRLESLQKQLNYYQREQVRIEELKKLAEKSLDETVEQLKEYNINVEKMSEEEILENIKKLDEEIERLITEAEVELDKQLSE